MTSAAIALNRFGLGARVGERPPADPRDWLSDQLTRYEPKPARLATQPPRSAAAAAIVGLYDARRDARQAAPVAMPMEGQASPAAQPDPERREAREAIRGLYIGAVQARADAAVASGTPFVERLVHFWSNHFAVSVEKLPVAAFAGSFEFDAIRPHVLGKFVDLLRAVERHPAMLVYLDQAQSIGPNSRAGQRLAAGRRPRGLNENLAREILELHTLGVRTGYGQADVTEFARALTGRTVPGIAALPALRRLAPTGDDIFLPQFHEPGARTILGRTFAEGGEEQADAVLAMLAAHPATARHLATKLARHFAGDAPPPALVARLEAAFLRSGGDLPTVYRALIDAPEPWAAAAPKFKTPWEWSISAARALGSPGFPAPVAANFLNQLGQPVWRPGAPAGFDDTAAAWAAPDALMRRVEAAERLVGRLPRDHDAGALASTALGGAPAAPLATQIARAESGAQAAALFLVSPEFLRR